MKIFVSYAREQLRIAESIAVRLRQEKHEVFFDRASLPAGEGYDAKIRNAIAGVDLFIFLISPESIKAGSYALTEYGFAENRWPDPSGHVLPVMVAPTPMDQVPPYLTTVTVLQPPGNLAAGVLAAVERIAEAKRIAEAEKIAAAEKIAGPRRRRLRWAIAGLGAIAVAVVLYVLVSGRSVNACYLKAELRRDDGSTIPPGMMLDVTYAGETSTFLTSQDASAAINVGPFKGGNDRWTIELRSPNGSPVGKETVGGCSAAAQEIRIGEVFNLILGPRG